MIKQVIDIKGYWKLVIVYNAKLEQKDVGFTYSDFNHKLSIVGIAPTTSKGEFFNTITHELKHVQSHICSYYNIPEDGEEAAYLIGYMMQEMHKCFRKIIKY